MPALIEPAKPPDNFYVGYQPKASQETHQFIRPLLIGLITLVIATAIVLTLFQNPFADSKFEYQNFRAYEGELIEWPYPSLLTRDGPFLLVAPGKHGAPALVKGLEGHAVTFDGELIQRGDQRMLEVRPESVKTLGTIRRNTRTPVDLGQVTLTGEIVDTKCYLGVMNPGNGKVHRDCAARCISGGAPPALLVRDAVGQTRILLLVGPDVRQIGHEILDFVAEPVRVTGRLQWLNSTLILRADPKNFHRE